MLELIRVPPDKEVARLVLWEHFKTTQDNCHVLYVPQALSKIPLVVLCAFLVLQDLLNLLKEELHVQVATPGPLRARQDLLLVPLARQDSSVALALDKLRVLHVQQVQIRVLQVSPRVPAVQ
jgi:hypothetical protein